MTLKLIACEVFYREVCACVAASPHRVDIEFTPKGAHDRSDNLREMLQAKIDAATTEAEKQRLKAERAKAQAAAEDAVRAKARPKAAAASPKKETGLKKSNCDPNDPLCGSGL